MLDGRVASAGASGSSRFVSSGGELRLTNPGQLDLLRGVAERGVPLRTSVRGTSMSPCIRDRDVVTIAPLEGGEPHVGDVVAFALPGGERMAIHRVVAAVGAEWLLKGDNCPEPDGVVADDDIVGRVVRVERDGRIVHLGLGVQGRWAAAASRGRALALARSAWRAPRRLAARVLGAAQGLPVYRRIGRRLGADFEILAATDADMEAVWRHLRPGAPRPRHDANLDMTCLVARRGGRVVGFAAYAHSSAEQGPGAGHWLSSLVVWRLHRCLGIGDALTHRVIAEARARKAAELRLVVFEDNASAISLCHKAGFSPCAEPESMHAEEKRRHGRRRIVMRRILDD